MHESFQTLLSLYDFDFYVINYSIYSDFISLK